jgi:nicotinamide mononucleotide adenylyltransferase
MRGFRPDAELDSFLEKHSDDGEKLPIRDAIEEFYRQKFSTPAELTTSDGRYKIAEDPVYKRAVLFQLKDIGTRQAWVPFHPEKLEEKVAKSSTDSWKRDLAERKDAREEESHKADMVIKKVQVLRLQKRYAPETMPQRCRVQGCSAAGVIFANMDVLNAHLREFHPERVADAKGVSLERITAGEFYGRQQLPDIKWQGQPE